jgi:hypothetical protein
LRSGRASGLFSWFRGSFGGLLRRCLVGWRRRRSGSDGQGIGCRRSICFFRQVRRGRGGRRLFRRRCRRRRDGRRSLDFVIAPAEANDQRAQNERSGNGSVDRAAGHLSLFFGERLAEIPSFTCFCLNRARQRQLHAEDGPPSSLRVEFYPTIVQLHKSKGVG